MSQRCLGDELVKGRPSVAICNHTVKADLVEIGRLELQHFVNSLAVDLEQCQYRDRQLGMEQIFTYDVSGLGQLLRGTIPSSKLVLDQLLTELVQQVEHLKVRA